MYFTETEGSVLDRPETLLGDGDHEKFAHYAPKHEIDASWLNGTPVKALCGKEWIPTRDPEKFPVCPTCKEIFQSLPDSAE